MTQSDTLIILGSSRSDGNTREAIHTVIEKRPVNLVDLCDLDISYFDYEGGNRDDDFIPLAEQMSQYSKIVLATPVYWYSMSARMKTFIDRWSDLVTVRKDLGRRLKGKELFLISSYGGALPESFEAPFSQTCKYLDIDYKGCFYFYSGSDEAQKQKNPSNAKEFRGRLWTL
jgi:multimeric flavodoxin WrbA